MTREVKDTRHEKTTPKEEGAESIELGLRWHESEFDRGALLFRADPLSFVSPSKLGSALFFTHPPLPI
jgi:hypothetical protein